MSDGAATLTGLAVGRALGWVALGGVAFLGLVALLAPRQVAGPALLLAAVTVAPGALMLAIAGLARRRRGGRVSTADQPSHDRRGG